MKIKNGQEEWSSPDLIFRYVPVDCGGQTDVASFYAFLQEGRPYTGELNGFNCCGINNTDISSRGNRF